MKSIITTQHTQAVHHNNGMVGSWNIVQSLLATVLKCTPENLNGKKDSFIFNTDGVVTFGLEALRNE